MFPSISLGSLPETSIVGPSRKHPEAVYNGNSVDATWARAASLRRILANNTEPLVIQLSSRCPFR